MSYPPPAGPSWSDPPQQPLSLHSGRATGREHGTRLAPAAQAENRPVSDCLATYPYALPLDPVQNPFTSLVPITPPAPAHEPVRSLHDQARRKRPSLRTLNSPHSIRRYTYPFALPSFNHVLGYISRPIDERDCRPFPRPPPFVIPLCLREGRRASTVTTTTEASMPVTPAELHPVLQQETPSTRKEGRVRSRNVQGYIYCVLCEKSFRARKGTIDVSASITSAANVESGISRLMVSDSYCLR